MTAKQRPVEPRSRRARSSWKAGDVYRRTLVLLAANDAPAKTLGAVLRAWACWCGAQLAVLVALSAEGAMGDMQVVGRSAHAVARELTGRQVSWAGRTVRSFTVEGHTVLTAPLASANGIDGLLAMGVRRPQRFDAGQRRRFGQLVPVAGFVLQLAARNQATPPRHSDGQRRLNRREREVTGLLIAGYSVKQAAASLGLSNRTVQTYVERLKQRYGQARLHALLAHLVRAGLA